MRTRTCTVSATSWFVGMVETKPLPPQPLWVKARITAPSTSLSYFWHDALAPPVAGHSVAYCTPALLAIWLAKGSNFCAASVYLRHDNP